jgi:hypothetical protein
MQKIILPFVVLIVSYFQMHAQVAVNTTGSNPAPSSMLDVNSPNKGVLLPRMTTQQRNGISSPETGLLVFDIDQQALYMYDGDGWRPFAYASDQAASFTPRYPSGNIGQVGRSVAMWGDFAVAGSPGDTANGVASGTAYIYAKENGAWKQKVKLAPSNGAAGDEFGYSVDIYDNIVIVGAPGRAISNANNRGRVYIFKRIGHVWQQVAGLQSSDGVSGERFGTAVAVYATTIAVGAPQTAAGAVYVFKDENSNWVQKAKLLPWTSANGMRFGGSIALWSSTLVVGAPEAWDMGTVFTFNNTDASGAIWSNGQRFDPEQSNFTNNFGASIAIHQNNLIVGAPHFRTPDGTSKGQVYIYKRSVNTFNKYTILGNEGENGKCGSSVAVDGNYFYIGCPWANGQRGKVITLHNTYHPGDMRTYFNSDSDATAEFGSSLSAYGENFMIGAPIRYPSVTFGRNPQ